MCKEKYPKNVNRGGLDKNYSELEPKINDNSFHYQNCSLLKTINQNLFTRQMMRFKQKCAICDGYKNRHKSRIKSIELTHHYYFCIMQGESLENSICICATLNQIESFDLRGEMAVTTTSRASSLSQAHFDEILI